MQLSRAPSAHQANIAAYIPYAQRTRYTLHYIALRSVTLRYVMLDYITPQCITFWYAAACHAQTTSPTTHPFHLSMHHPIQHYIYVTVHAMI